MLLRLLKSTTIAAVHHARLLLVERRPSAKPAVRLLLLLLTCRPAAKFAIPPLLLERSAGESWSYTRSVVAGLWGLQFSRLLLPAILLGHGLLRYRLLWRERLLHALLLLPLPLVVEPAVLTSMILLLCSWRRSSGRAFVGHRPLLVLALPSRDVFVAAALLHTSCHLLLLVSVVPVHMGLLPLSP